MTQPASPQYPAPVAVRTSKSAIFSLIFGILFCVPFLTGGLAMLLGLIGFFRAGKPGVKGRWMAVVGGLLGTISVVIWFLFFGTLFALIMGAAGMLKEPEANTHDFVRDVAAADYASVEAHNPGWDEADLKKFHDTFAKEGTFVDTSFDEFQMNNDHLHLGGQAKFSNGSRPIQAELDKEGGTWHVKEFKIGEK